MKRLRHWLFNFATHHHPRWFRAVIVLLLVLVVAAWVSSYLCNLQLIVTRADLNRRSFCSGRLEWLIGDIKLRYDTGTRSDMGGWKEGWQTHIYVLRTKPALSKELSWVKQSRPHWMGFQVLRVDVDSPDATNHAVWAIIPFWAPTLLLLMPPGWWLVIYFRNLNRRATGHCPICGYDLRATPDRCPECGAIPSAAKGAAT